MPNLPNQQSSRQQNTTDREGFSGTVNPSACSEFVFRYGRLLKSTLAAVASEAAHYHDDRYARLRLPGARVTNSAVQTFAPSPVVGTLTWDTLANQNGSCYDPVSPTRLMAPEAGIYRASVNIEWVGTFAVFPVQTRIMLNSATSVAVYRNDTINSGIAYALSTDHLSLAAGDYVDVDVEHWSGVAEQVSAACVFTLQKITNG